MMALALTMQIHAGFGWIAVAWQATMAAIMWSSLASWNRLRDRAPAEIASKQRIRRLADLAALCGSCWAVGLVVRASPEQPQLALMGVATSLIFATHASANWYFAPWAVIAFSVPLIAGSIFVFVATQEPSVAQIGILLIALHAFTTLWLLRKNWANFAHLTDLDVERNRLSAMLQEQKEIAERAVQLKSRFLASASHDLRQPMHAISLYLDGLARIELPDRARMVIDDARVCAHDLIDMFRSLLDISRLDAEQAIPALSIFSVADVLSRVEKEFLPLASARGIALKVRPCSAHAYSDPVMVERIVLNFVSNAVRYTPNGRVLVTCRVRGSSLRLAVYDTGKGIPESEQQAIFDEFRRLDPSRPHDRTGGLGLGLAIVRRLALALRLPVTVRSAPDKGSMFAVDLPLSHVSRGRPVQAIAERSLAGRLIVLIDDEQSILRAASFILQVAGCEVICARSGQEATQLLADTTRVPDAIVCDYELNDACNGSQVIRRLREEFNLDIPAVLVTGNTAGGRVETDAGELGIGVLYKPLEAAALTGSLEELLFAKER
ncbi:hybrid sensor histidine kinase/response regulator [Caenimonas sp. SL110]|uniref:ATP-binding response regulator n=1 Tax=Caenimonas sp. SL110 TaxID=1450524 RepID=UPI001379209B|nr:hybrid sensor histidine kinase/response regulator [Caenimonas sp. SL110]